MAKTNKEKLDFIDEAKDTMEGFEEVNAQTMAIPFLKLAQDLTPQTKKLKLEYIEGLEVGQFFNSVTGEIYGTHIEIIILKFERIYIEWLPSRGGFVGYHSPENAERLADDLTFGKWKTREGNDLVEYYAYYILVSGDEEDGPIIMSLASTAIKTAKALNRMMTTHALTKENGTPILDANGKQKRARPYYLVYNVDAVPQTKGANDFFGYKFVFKDYITEEQDKLISKERDTLPNKTVDYALIDDKTHESTEQYDDSDL